MVQSLNTTVNYSVKATSYLGFATYGDMLLGNHAIEFYNEKNTNDFIQIPWREIDRIIVSVMFKGKWIPRFSIVTKQAGTYTFSTRDNKQVIKTVNKYLSKSQFYRSLSFIETLKSGIRVIVARFHQ